MLARTLVMSLLLVLWSALPTTASDEGVGCIRPTDADGSLTAKDLVGNWTGTVAYQGMRVEAEMNFFDDGTFNGVITGVFLKGGWSLERGGILVLSTEGYPQTASKVALKDGVLTIRQPDGGVYTLVKK